MSSPKIAEAEADHFVSCNPSTEWQAVLERRDARRYRRVIRSMPKPIWRSMSAPRLRRIAFSRPATKSRAKSRSGGRCMGLTIMESISSNGPSRAYQITVRTAQQLDGCLRRRAVAARRQNDHEVAVRNTNRSRNHTQGEPHVPASTEDSRRTSKLYSHS